VFNFTCQFHLPSLDLKFHAPAIGQQSDLTEPGVAQFHFNLQFEFRFQGGRRCRVFLEPFGDLERLIGSDGRMYERVASVPGVPR
jgi:hypothetical protein